MRYVVGGEGTHRLLGVARQLRLPVALARLLLLQLVLLVLLVVLGLVWVVWMCRCVSSARLSSAHRLIPCSHLSAPFPRLDPLEPSLPPYTCGEKDSVR